MRVKREERRPEGGAALRWPPPPSSATFFLHLAPRSGAQFTADTQKSTTGSNSEPTPPPTPTVIICQKAAARSRAAAARNVAQPGRAGANGAGSDTLPAAAPAHGWLRCPTLVANSAGPATSTSAEQPAASPPLLSSPRWLIPLPPSSPPSHRPFLPPSSPSLRPPSFPRAHWPARARTTRSGNYGNGGCRWARGVTRTTAPRRPYERVRAPHCYGITLIASRSGCVWLFLCPRARRAPMNE